jgi:hypothetical protein
VEILQSPDMFPLGQLGNSARQTFLVSESSLISLAGVESIAAVFVLSPASPITPATWSTPQWRCFNSLSYRYWICLTPWRRQDLVQVLISGSSITLLPCCIVMHTWAHLFSSTE